MQLGGTTAKYYQPPAVLSTPLFGSLADKLHEHFFTIIVFDDGLLLDTYLHLIKNKRYLMSVESSFLSSLMKTLDRSVKTFGLES